MELLEVNSPKYISLPQDWIPLGFFSLRLVHTEPPALRGFQFLFPSQALALGKVSTPVNCGSFNLPVSNLSLQIWGQWFTL